MAIIERNIGLGERLGTGIGEALKSLANTRLQRIQQDELKRQAIPAFRALNFEPGVAEALVNLDPKIQKSIIEQKLAEPQNEAYLQALESLLGNNQQTSSTQQQQPSNTFSLKRGINQQQATKLFDIASEQRDKQQKLQPKINELSQRSEAFKYLKDLNQGDLKKGILGIGRDEKTQEYEGILEMLTSGLTKPEAESLRERLSLSKSKNIRDKLIDREIKKLEGELGSIQPQNTLQQPQLPLNSNLQNTNENAPNPNENLNQEQDQSQTNPYLKGAGYLAKRAAVGGLSGITSLAGLPFNIANLVSLGNIPVPNIVSQIQDLPQQTVESIAGKIGTDSEGLKWLGDWVEDISSLLLPGTAIGKLGKFAKIAKLERIGKLLGSSPKAAATISAAGNLAKLAAEKLGGTETESNLAKAGGMLLPAILSPRIAAFQVNKLADEAKSALRATDVVRSPELLKKNMEFYSALTKGGSTPIKETIKQNVEKLFHQTKPATFNASDIFAAKQALTQASENPEFVKSLRNALPAYNEIIDKTLSQISNTKFQSFFNEFNDLGNALKTKNIVSEFAGKNLGATRYKDPITYALLGYGLKELTGLPSVYKAIGATAIPALTLGETQRLLKIASQSPAFRKYYGKYISAALRGNVKSAQTFAKSLDNTLSKEGS